MLRPRQLYSSSSRSSSVPFCNIQPCKLQLRCSNVYQKPWDCTGASRRQATAARRSVASAAVRRTGQQPEEALQSTALERLIVSQIKDISNDSPTGLQELADVVTKWGSSFNYIHASAAFVKAASFGSVQPAAAAPVLDRLAGIWDDMTQACDTRGLANVLWACGKLRYRNQQLWTSTLAEVLQRVPQPDMTGQETAAVVYGVAKIAGGPDGTVPGMSVQETAAAMRQLCSHMQLLLSNPHLEALDPQQISNTLWACAKLRLNPGSAALDSLLKGMADSTMLERAAPQALSNSLWAVSDLRRSTGWQPKLGRQAWQRLLDDRYITRVANRNTPQGVSNALLAVGWLSEQAGAAAGAVVDRAVGHQCANQLLTGSVARQQLNRWNGQDVGNAMWACAKLGLQHQEFMANAAAKSHVWLKRAAPADIKQAAYAVGSLQHRDEALVAGMLTWCKQQTAPPQSDKDSRHVRRAPAAEVRVACSMVCWAVMALDMQSLAGEVKAVLSGCGEQQPPWKLHPADAGRLWDVHSWLVQHQQLDGQGLAGVLTQQQLAECRAASDVFHASAAGHAQQV